jgi:hypothetical protein
VAPEILRELPYNEKCDVFSYAVVLWELYTRHIPWHKVGAFRVANDVAYQGARYHSFQPFSMAAFTSLASLIVSRCWVVCMCVCCGLVVSCRVVSAGVHRLPLPHDCPRKLAALIEFCWDANPDVRRQRLPAVRLPLTSSSP